MLFATHVCRDGSDLKDLCECACVCVCAGLRAKSEPDAGFPLSGRSCSLHVSSLGALRRDGTFWMASVVFPFPLGSVPGMCLSDGSAGTTVASNISRHVFSAFSLTRSFVVF